MPVVRIGRGDFPHRLRRILPLPFTMYDSVTVAELPARAAAVAGYVNGRWPTFPDLARTHPHARRLPITITAQADARCLDIENGDATISQAPAWVRRQRGRGLKRPCLYIELSQAAALLATLERAGIPRRTIDLWTAHYTGRPHRCGPGCGYGLTTRADATQWTNRAHGRNLDASRCRPRFLHH